MASKDESAVDPAQHVHTLACGCTAIRAPGWAALEALLIRTHGGDPTYFSSQDLEDECPVESIAVFRVEEPAPHWHLVSCGLSELYDKKFISPEVSGFGFELTMRVPLREGEENPPSWPIQLLRNLGRYLTVARQPFAEGEHMNAHAPLALDEPCTLTAVCFLEDPALGAIQTPNGSLRFLQVLGLTEDELEAVMDGDPHDFIALVAQQNPLFISLAARDSYLADEELARVVDERIETEGSTATGSFADDLIIAADDGVLVLTLGAMHVRALVRGLRHRVPFEREYALRGPRCEVLLAPAAQSAWHADDERATIMLTADAARELAGAIGPERGRYTASSVERLVIEVVPTELADADGNIVDVIG